MAETIKVVIRYRANEDPNERRGEWKFPSSVSVQAAE